MVQLSATRCSCIAILWVSLVNFAAITLCVASQRVFIVYFVMSQSGNFWIHLRIVTHIHSLTVMTNLAASVICTHIHIHVAYERRGGTNRIFISIMLIEMSLNSIFRTTRSKSCRIRIIPPFSPHWINSTSFHTPPQTRTNAYSELVSGSSVWKLEPWHDKKYTYTVWWSWWYGSTRWMWSCSGNTQTLCRDITL
jgi:hypothetical protein